MRSRHDYHANMEKIPFYALYGESRPPGNEVDFVHLESDLQGGQKRLVIAEIGPHRHESLHQFIYLERGEMLLTLDTLERCCAGPAVVSIPPLTVHSLRFDEASRRCVLTLAQPFLARLAEEEMSIAVERLLTQPMALELSAAGYPADQIHGLVMLLHREFYSQLEGRSSVIAALVRLLVLQLGRLAAPQNGPQPGHLPQDGIYSRFKAAVEQHYQDHWEVQQYAELLGVTEDRLNQICKRATGHTPSQLIHARLLMEAKRNLAYTKKSISVIAYELGFGEPSYFSRFFRKYAGETATAFRTRQISS